MKFKAYPYTVLVVGILYILLYIAWTINILQVVTYSLAEQILAILFLLYGIVSFVYFLANKIPEHRILSLVATLFAIFILISTTWFKAYEILLVLLASFVLIIFSLYYIWQKAKGWIL